MSRNHIIAGIDIGNANIKTVIANIDTETGRPHILGVGISPSTGMRKGAVVDMNETVRNVAVSVQKAESMSGVKIREAYTSLNGPHIRSQISRGVIAVSRADNEISQHDMNRVIEAASTVSLPPNREKIRVIPKQFIIDGQEYVKNPVGMKGVRIEADVMIIDGLSPYIHNMVKAINENNIEVLDFVFSPLANASAVLDKSQKEHGVLNLDLGGGMSSLSFFKEGELVHSAILPIGSRHITNDLAIILRTSMEAAEQVKLQYGYVSTSKAGKKEEFDLSDVLNEEDAVFSKKEIEKVIEARVDEIFDMVNNEIKKIGSINMIPAGLVISGGGANLPGLIAYAKERTNLPVRLGKSQMFGGMTDQLNDLSFATAAGLVIWGVKEELKGSSFKSFPLFNSSSFIKRAIGWLKNFLP